MRFLGHCLPFLALWLLFASGEDEQPKCTIKYAAPFLHFPDCAQYCIACEDSNLSFGHNCYYASGQCCTVDVVGSASVRYVWDCVLKSCPAAEAQSAVDLWVKDCADLGMDAPVSLLPSDLESPSIENSKSQTGKSSSVATSPSSAAASRASTQTSEILPAATSEHAEETSSVGSSEHEMRVNIGIGLGVGIPTVLIALWMCWCAERKRLAKKRAKKKGTEGSG